MTWGSDEYLTVSRRGDEEPAWAVLAPHGRLNKTTHKFDHEPLPSSRSKEWVKEHSFTLADAIIEAVEVAQRWDGHYEQAMARSRAARGVV